MGNFLKKLANKTLELNTLNIGHEKYITAGCNQFKTLWTRDFCFSVPGLLTANHSQLVKDQLLLILSYKHKEHFLPRGLDIVSPKWRVLAQTFPQVISQKILIRDYPQDERLFQQQIRAEYHGEHGTIAFDSNILFVLAYLNYVEKNNNEEFLKVEQLQTLINFYQPYYIQGFFRQPSFSDWQDSAKRKGIYSLFQILMVIVLRKMQDRYQLKFFNINVGDFERKIASVFFNFNSYLFYQDEAQLQLGLDTYSFIFQYQLFSLLIDLNKFYRKLKQSPLWLAGGLPGVPVFPQYAFREVSWVTKLVGLRHYHDKLYWGWLVAEACKISLMQKDIAEFQRIRDIFEKSHCQSTHLWEVYQAYDKFLIPYKNWAYTSEGPFTWTAAKWLEAMSYEINVEGS